MIIIVCYPASPLFAGCNFCDYYSGHYACDAHHTMHGRRLHPSYTLSEKRPRFNFTQNPTPCPDFAFCCILLGVKCLNLENCAAAVHAQNQTKPDIMLPLHCQRLVVRRSRPSTTGVAVFGWCQSDCPFRSLAWSVCGPYSKWCIVSYCGWSCFIFQLMSCFCVCASCAVSVPPPKNILRFPTTQRRFRNPYPCCCA